MKYLCFQRQKYGPDRAERYTTAVVKTMPRRYGPVTHVEVLSRKRSVLIVGAHDSGKSRWLRRLHKEAPDIWRKAGAPLMVSALRPLAAWSDEPFLAAWWDAKGADDGEHEPWARLKPWRRIDALPAYLAETGSPLFIDDAHRLTGRKADVARLCALSARVIVCAASDEQRIPPSLRAIIMRRDPHYIRLSSDVAYDTTGIFVWLIALALLLAGAYEAGLVVAGLKALAGGRRASRQDA